MKTMRIPARSLIVFLFLCFAGWAQTQTPAAQLQTTTPQETDKRDDPKGEGKFSQRFVSNEVNVIFTVTDKHGKFIKDLTQNEFKVLDNSRPQAIREFRAQTDLPLRIGLLIDASNSIRDRFLFEQQAAIEFLQQTIRLDKDKAFSLTFDEVPELTQDFTSDKAQLTK